MPPIDVIETNPCPTPMRRRSSLPNMHMRLYTLAEPKDSDQISRSKSLTTMHLHPYTLAKPMKINKIFSANNRKHLLTSPNSVLGKLDLIQMVRGSVEWDDLDVLVKARTDSHWAASFKAQPPHDVNVHPLDTECGKAMENWTLAWQGL